ncbi:MAG: DinB family protein [Gemmatimonadetes bacterium]|nr:DinB family protein [Gemmatimonadota bacterium]
MPIAKSLKIELEEEALTTRRVLERVPEEHLSWRAHPTSMSLGQLALHIAQTPGTIAQMAQADAMEVPNFKQAEATSRAEVLEAHDQSIAAFAAMLRTMPDERLMAKWSLSRRGAIVATMPRVAFIRSVGMNHVYHHRGQLVMCLRMLHVPVPSVYGPSRDENPFA